MNAHTRIKYKKMYVCHIPQNQKQEDHKNIAKHVIQESKQETGSHSIIACC